MNNLLSSPYDGLDKTQWKQKTVELVNLHPLRNDIVDVVLQCWSDIFASTFGKASYQIGEDIFPAPQIMAFLLHELIPLELTNRYPGKWHRDSSADEKDVVCVFDESYSMEIKASSNPRNIFANRSYAQPNVASKKHKAGYYLAINFESVKQGASRPRITMVRMGWLEHSDWKGQKSPTGQQASLTLDARDSKLLQLYSV